MTLLNVLAQASTHVAATSGRLAKVGALAEVLKTLPPHEISAGAHYLSGTLPQGRIGIGFAQLQSAAPLEVASQPALTVHELSGALDAVVEARGKGAAARRTQILRSLLARATAAESDFLRALLGGGLRQGAMGGLMVEAIAVAAGLPVASVRAAAMYAPDLGTLAHIAITQRSAGLAKFSLALFSPVTPMLAQTATDPGQAISLLGSRAIVFEWKLDGARIQAHKRGNEVHIYTRSLNEVTDAIPEIAQTVRSLGADSLVLDGEAIAMDAAGRPHPFQVTMRRFGRKLDVEQARATLPIQAFFFDCLFKDGSALVDQPGLERYRQLAAAVPAELLVPRSVTSSVAEAELFYQAALAAGHEGVMAKALDAPYEAGNRGASWLKIKRAHTLDLVVLAAEWGHGRRTGRLSNLHLGARDAATGQFTMLGKTFKGLTDAMLEWQTAELLAREIRRDSLTVWVRPELVAEIAFSDLQASKRYPGGIALRLARVKRYRSDKTAEQADDMDTVRRLFEAQAAGAQPVDGARITRNGS